MLDLCFSTLAESKFSKFTKRQRADREVIRDVPSTFELINTAFLRNGVGYRFEGRELLKVSDELMHSQVVEPALRLLYAEGFEGPLDEYLRAHRHYRDGQPQDAVLDAHHAFESTLKTILPRLGVALTGEERPDQLIQAATTMFVPKHLASSLKSLSAVVQGLTTLRNKTPGVGHGQGESTSDFLDATAAYALHLAGANIVFAIEAFHAASAESH